MRKYTTKMLQNQKESCRLLTTSAFLTIAPKIERFSSENQMIIHLKVSIIFALSFRWFSPRYFDHFRLDIRWFSPWVFDDFASENDNNFTSQYQWSILIKPNICINFPSTKHWFLHNTHYICRMKISKNNFSQNTISINFNTYICKPLTYISMPVLFY